MFTRLSLIFVLSVSVQLGCSSDATTTDDTPTTQPAVRYALDSNVYTTLDQTWVPKTLSDATKQAIDDRTLTITDITEYEANGIGIEIGPGEPWQEFNQLAPGYDAFVTQTSETPVSLTYFWQTADPQVVDEESPLRYAGVYLITFGSTYKPQSHLTNQVFESHVRSAKRISDLSSRPFDFALAAGDLVDTGQENEFDWFITAMSGGVIDPDSGIDDDPVPGPGNDFNDPFTSDGIGIPWYAAIGNHESLYIGSFALTEEAAQAATGTEVYDGIRDALGLPSAEGVSNGFRDGSTVHADIRTEGPTPADPKRRVLSLSEVIDKLYNAPGEPQGHGFAADAASTEIGYYAVYPIPNAPIKLVVLNTLQQEPASAEGQVDQTQFDWMRSELSASDQAGEIVILMSHHRSGDLTDDSDISTDEFQDEVGSHPSVVVHVTGHGHYNRKESITPVDASHGYWELMLASTLDFPMQSRIFEIVYEGDGYLTIYATNIDHNAPVGSFAHQGRILGAGRQIFQNTDYPEVWADRVDARNLILRTQVSAEMRATIEAHDGWSDTIESQQTLLNLQSP